MTSVQRARTSLAGGAALGLSGDLLLHGAPYGLSLTAWLMMIPLAVVVTRRGGVMSGETYTWLGVAAALAVLQSIRASEALNFLAFLGCIAALALPALRAGAAWIRAGTPAEYIAAFAASALRGAGGAAWALRAAQLSGLTGPAHPRWRHASAAARGVLIALPLLVIFIGLFTAADAVFADIVADTVRIDVGPLANHFFLAAFLAWVGAGYLYGFSRGGTAMLERVPVKWPTLGITEIATVLTLLNLLFVVFVAVQFRYLFGGSGMVELTPGLTWSAWARRGFFELVFAVLLVVPLLLGADALLRRTHRSHELIFRALANLQVLLVLGIAASAFERMRLYRAAWGLTEQRVYATALLILIAFVLVWLAATVLQGRRRGFAFGAVVAGLVTIIALHVVNPDALIARTNIARAVEQAVRGELDVAYTTSLSADAVPVLVDMLPQLGEDPGCRVARRMLRRWGDPTAADPGAWNLADARARTLVRRHEPLLRSFVPAHGECDTAPTPPLGAL
jgi:hypothetical protein